jgi:hypothetical protein
MGANADEERIPLQSSCFSSGSSKRMTPKHRNYSNGTIVTSNRSSDNVVHAQYPTYQSTTDVDEEGLRNGQYTPLHHKRNLQQPQQQLPPLSQKKPTTTKHTGNIAIVTSALTCVLCTAALLYYGSSFVWNSIGNTRSGDRIGREDANASSTTTTRHAIMDQQRLYAQQYYDSCGRYILEDYDIKPIMTNFLPGLSGIYGIPLFTFYMNRGQAITSFGYKSKEYPIQEFHSANIAQQSTPFTGFRTFLQVTSKQSATSTRSWFSSWIDDRQYRGSTTKLIEPFSPLRSRREARKGDDDNSNVDFMDSCDTHDDRATDTLPKRYMYIGSNEVQIQEIDTVNKIETNVTFFVLPEEDFGAFAKRTTITNLQRDTKRRMDGAEITISLLDGLTNIIPAGGKMNDLLKNMGLTLQSWMKVDSPYNDTVRMPYYRLSMLPTDTEQVTIQEAGHWCLSIIDENMDTNSAPELLPIIYDPSIVFGDDTTLIRPTRLESHTISHILAMAQQYGRGKTPSAFAALTNITLRAGQSVTITTFFGKADHILDVPVIARRLLQPGFAEFKLARAGELAKQITSSVDGVTSNPLMDGHVQQMFLDNSLRGGMPQILGEDNDDSKLRCTDEDERLKVLHLFSRIHGDMERDYNSFEIAPTFFSNVSLVVEVLVPSLFCLYHLRLRSPSSMYRVQVTFEMLPKTAVTIYFSIHGLAHSM